MIKKEVGSTKYYLEIDKVPENWDELTPMDRTALAEIVLSNATVPKGLYKIEQILEDI